MADIKDPIAFELFKNSIFSIADEMALTICRTTYSGVLRDNMDFFTAFADADGRLVAQGLTLGLLQMSIKMTNEAPAGIKAGLKNSYAWINQDMLDSVSQPQWRVMLYALCFMHTIV